MMILMHLEDLKITRKFKNGIHKKYKWIKRNQNQIMQHQMIPLFANGQNNLSITKIDNSKCLHEPYPISICMEPSPKYLHEP